MPKSEEKRKERPKPAKRKKNESLELLRNVAKSMAHAVPFISDETRDTVEDSLARPISGIASQYMGYNEDTGQVENAAIANLRRIFNADARRKQGLPPEKRVIPGMVADALSLPNMLGNGPEWSQKMQERADLTHSLVDEGMGLAPPQGFRQNALDSLGVMAGQIPVPGREKVETARNTARGALQLMKRLGRGVATSPIEFMSPTVDPKMSNYLLGALGGGTLGSLGDEVPVDEMNPPHATAKAEGGKIRGSTRALRKAFDAFRDFTKPSKESQASVEYALRNNDGQYLELLDDSGWIDQLSESEVRSLLKSALSTTTETDDLKSILLPEDMTTYRGVLSPRFREVFDLPQSSSLSRRTSEGFAYPGGTLVRILPGENNLVFPNPFSGEDEFIIPSNKRLLKYREGGLDDVDAEVIRIEKAKGGKVGALQAFLKSIALNPDARVKQTAYQMGDPIEEVLYATNEGQRRGVLSSVEAEHIKDLLKRGEEEELAEALASLHSRLNPKVGPPILQNSPKPYVAPPSRDFREPVNAHGTMPVEEFERIIKPGKANGGIMRKAKGGKVKEAVSGLMKLRQKLSEAGVEKGNELVPLEPPVSKEGLPSEAGIGQQLDDLNLKLSIPPPKNPLNPQVSRRDLLKGAAGAVMPDVPINPETAAKMLVKGAIRSTPPNETIRENLINANSWLFEESDEPYWEGVYEALSKIPGSRALLRNIRKMQKFYESPDFDEDFMEDLGHKIENQIDDLAGKHGFRPNPTVRTGGVVDFEIEPGPMDYDLYIPQDYVPKDRYVKEGSAREKEVIESHKAQIARQQAELAARFDRVREQYTRGEALERAKRLALEREQMFTKENSEKFDEKKHNQLWREINDLRGAYDIWDEVVDFLSQND